MLQRMNELATQASNGTNSETDRQAIQDEIDQLTKEIDRVSETTKFNETYLLKGDGEAKEHTVNAHDAGIAGATLTDNGNGTVAVTLKKLNAGDTVSIAGKEYTIGASADDVKKAVDTPSKGDTIKVGDTEYKFEDGTSTDSTGTTTVSEGWYASGTNFADDTKANWDGEKSVK